MNSEPPGFGSKKGDVSGQLGVRTALGSWMMMPGEWRGPGEGYKIYISSPRTCNNKQ